MCTICSNTLAEKAKVEAEKAQVEAENAECLTVISRLNKNITGLEQEINLLREMLKLARLQKFGPPAKDSQEDHPQFDGLLAECDELNGEVEKEEAAVEHVEYDRKKADRNKNLNGRVSIPDHLERRDVILDLPEDQRICPVTGEPMIKIGEDITEQLAIDPVKIYVIRHIRPKYVSPDRRKGAKVGVKTAPLPEMPIDRCKADVSLLSHIITGKYSDHIPFYRQEQMFARDGITIPANTMYDWAGACADKLKPLHGALRDFILSNDYINTDDTPIDMLEKGRGSTKQGRLWVTCRGSGPPGIYFNFTENWQSEHPKKMFEKFKGYFQSDCYPGYVNIGQREDIIPLGCWAHVKNKFEDAKAIGDKQARQFVILINILYRIEHRIAKLPQEMPDAQKLALRQKRARRVMKRFFDKVKSTHALPKSTLGKALNYAANHEQPLKNYLLDLRFKPDNNVAERAIRPVCIGRRNFLFVGSKRGGETAAIFMSIIATCKANGVNPHEYLKDILARINSHPFRKLAELLPHNWKAAPEKK